MSAATAGASYPPHGHACARDLRGESDQAWLRRRRNDYTASSMTALEGLEAVRKRPGMYIGSTGERGLHHLVQEVVDNAVDEALAGFCDTIVVTLLADGGVRVKDNGRGIPVDINPKTKKTGIEMALTMLHAGGKFEGKAYTVSGGLHGVGVSVVNALSTRVEVEVQKDGYIWTQQYLNSKPVAPLAKGGTTRKTGTTVTFWPDPKIFETTTFDFQTIYRRLQEMAFLNRGLTIALSDERLRDGDADVGGPQRGHLLLQGRHRRLRPPPQPDQDADPQVGGRVQRRGRGHVGRDRHAVERVLRRERLHLRQHDQHARGWHPRRGLPVGADRGGQQVRQRQEVPQGGREAHRRGHPRGSGRHRVGQDDQPAVRGPDQDQARQHRR